VQPGLVEFLRFGFGVHGTLDNTGMPAIQLTPAQRKEHRSEAHHLDPIVMIGGDGLTPAVKKEADAALKAHGLIKVRVFSDDRAARELMLKTLADELDAAPIQHIGKLLVLWRPIPEKERTVDEDRMPGPRDVKVIKYAKRFGQRPEIKTLRVLGNQRLTPGGTIKRAKAKRPLSAKKRNQAD
jgi:RNA-binding protein